MNQEKLFDIESDKKSSGSVECLGMTFESDEARRAYFTDLLRKKLKDPEFRAIEGFPIGTDEAILELSDPPYYTACPNPWISDYIEKYSNTEQHLVREPYSVDVTVGKSDPVYKAHSYHTKVPHLAIVPSILHYTKPGDIVLDGFGGAGMTGVAAQWCGIASDEYKIDLENNWSGEGRKKPLWGSRKVILNELSPAATHIEANYNIPMNIKEFLHQASNLLDELEGEFSWIYKTKHDESNDGDIDFVVWSDVFSCPECEGELIFHDHALDKATNKVLDVLSCPNCGADVNKKKLHLIFEAVFDHGLGKVEEKPKRVPVKIRYTYNKKKYFKSIDENDRKLLGQISQLGFPKSAPITEFPDMQMMRVGRMKTTKVTHVHNLFMDRTLHVLSSYFEKVSRLGNSNLKKALRVIAQHQFVNSSIMNRYRPASSFGNSPLTGVYYVSSLIAEANVLSLLRGSINRIKKMNKSEWSEISGLTDSSIISTSSTTDLKYIPDGSIDYIFTDPPFGENIYYSDLNFLAESWFGVHTQAVSESIVDRVRGKDVFDYQLLMKKCFDEYFRVLKRGKWITIVFHNSKSSIWNAIQTSLQLSGFVVADVRVLDKKHHSFQQIMSGGTVKQDLVISAYKPLLKVDPVKSHSVPDEQIIWDFLNSHLKMLPVSNLADNELEVLIERTAHSLFDRVVSFLFRLNYTLPFSKAEFVILLVEKYSQRDGMFFLPEQVTSYDKVRVAHSKIRQLSIFIESEQSAIIWLRENITKKPMGFSDIHPLFSKEVSGWSKHEQLMELSTLLEQNFLKYDGKDDVPSQIHTYLSTNFKDMRGLDKSDPKLVAKAKDRWYVPDPNKAADLEKVRLRALLKEFETYKAEKKKIKQPRAEALRAGFNSAWEAQDFQTILDIAKKIPTDVLQEDEKLLMFYDNALTLTSTEDDEW